MDGAGEGDGWMLRYTIIRLLWMIPTLIGMSLIIFVLMHNVPGSPLDPVGANNPLTLDEQQILAEKYGLDKPLWQQYLTYIGNAARFDFGDSFRQRETSVKTIIGRGLKYSVYLGVLAMTVAIVGGVTLGMLAASKQNSPIDHACSVLAMLGVSFPNYVVGVFLIYFFVLQLGWIPRTGGLEQPVDWILPTIALALGPLGIIARYVRSSMVDVVRSDYVRTARSKGATERRVMTRHVLKNSLIPPLTILGPLIAAVLTGSPAVEVVFRIPGIGQYFALSIIARDYTMIMAVFLLFGVFLIFMNLIVDLLYGVADPRIRYS